MHGGGIGTGGRAGAARSVGWSSQLPGRSAWLRVESLAAAAETPSPALAALAAPWSRTRSAAEKRSIAGRVVDENLLQTPTRQRNRMSSSLNTYL